MENKPQVMRGHGLRDALFLLCQEVKVVNESKTGQKYWAQVETRVTFGAAGEMTNWFQCLDVTLAEGVCPDCQQSQGPRARTVGA